VLEKTLRLKRATDDRIRSHSALIAPAHCPRLTWRLVRVLNVVRCLQRPEPTGGDTFAAKCSAQGALQNDLDTATELHSQEPWLLHEFEDDFYDEELRLVVVGYIRPEVKWQLFVTSCSFLRKFSRNESQDACWQSAPGSDS
jgi:hypothetical protein